jgi:hypothetical protein
MPAMLRTSVAGHHLASKVAYGHLRLSELCHKVAAAACKCDGPSVDRRDTGCQSQELKPLTAHSRRPGSSFPRSA